MRKNKKPLIDCEIGDFLCLVTWGDPIELVEVESVSKRYITANGRKYSKNSGLPKGSDNYYGRLYMVQFLDTIQERIDWLEEVKIKYSGLSESAEEEITILKSFLVKVNNINGGLV